MAARCWRRATPPVEEMIGHEENGLLAAFYDVDRFVEQALAVLDDPAAYRHLGQAGAAHDREPVQPGKDAAQDARFVSPDGEGGR